MTLWQEGVGFIGGEHGMIKLGVVMVMASGHGGTLVGETGGF